MLDLVRDLVYNVLKGVPRLPQKVNIHEAKTHFSKLIARVNNGEEIIIAKGGTPVARLVPMKEYTAERVPGTGKGKITMTPDFDDPLPESIMKEFEK